MTVSEEELLAWAKRYDPQYFHSDPEAARSSVFAGLVAPGIYTAAIWRQLDHEINGDVRYICGNGWDEVRWPNPLRPGESVQACSEVLSLEPHPRHADRGRVLYAYRLQGEDGRLRMSMRSHNLVERRNAAAP
jgi:acyl dehydratase